VDLGWIPENGDAIRLLLRIKELRSGYSRKGAKAAKNKIKSELTVLGVLVRKN
jgi:hypothetical protein